VHVVVRPHDIFQRDGDDLYCEVPISVVTASLGGELEIPTLNGRVNLKIPAESQSGKLFRLRGKGVKSVRGSQQGDLLCRISVETPVNLTKKQKELLKDFEASMREDNVNHSPRASSWLDGVKKFFEDMKT
jgi:molecular chaperone DnaJ